MFLSKRLVQSSVDAIGTRCTYVILKQRILYMFFLVLPVFFSAHCILALYAWKMHNNGVKAKTKASRARKLHKPSECLCRKFAQGRKIINPSGGYPSDINRITKGFRRTLPTNRISTLIGHNPEEIRWISGVSTGGIYDFPAQNKRWRKSDRRSAKCHILRKGNTN